MLPYSQSRAVGVPGAEKALQSFIGIIRKWISVERWFCDAPSYADCVDNVRKLHKDDVNAVLLVCRAHEQLKTTSYILARIMSAIDDGARFDLTTSGLAKRVSVVAGAAGLPSALPSIAEVGGMGQKKLYSEVALRARKLLNQESMPSLEQRKKSVLDAAQQLTESESKKAEDLLADQTPVLDVFFPVLKKVAASNVEVGLLELIAKRLYRTYTMKDVERKYEDRLFRFTFTNKASEQAIHKLTSISSMTELSSVLSTSSLTNLSEYDSDTKEKSKLVAAENLEKIPSNITRTGVFRILESVESFSDASTLEAILKNFPRKESAERKAATGPINVLYLIIPGVSVGEMRVRITKWLASAKIS